MRDEQGGERVLSTLPTAVPRTMLAGRDLDEAVAVAVMGWQWRQRTARGARYLMPPDWPLELGERPASSDAMRDVPWWLDAFPAQGAPRVVPHYSTNLEDAATVANALVRGEWKVWLYSGNIGMDWEHSVRVSTASTGALGVLRRTPTMQGLAWAICLAAVRAAERAERGQ